MVRTQRALIKRRDRDLARRPSSGRFDTVAHTRRQRCFPHPPDVLQPMKQILFFATGGDLIAVLDLVEQTGALTYVGTGRGE